MAKVKTTKVPLTPEEKEQQKKEKAEAKRIETIEHDIAEATKNVETLLAAYKYNSIIINTEEQLSQYIDAAKTTGEIAIDTETTGLNVYRDKIVGVCLYTEGQAEAYVPINHVNYKTGERLPYQLDSDVVAKYLNKLNTVKIIMHNADFDIRILRKIGAPLKCYWDTLIAATLLNENEEHGLKPLHQKYILKNESDEFSYGKLFSTKIMTFADIPIKIAAIYAAHDAKITKELKDFQESVFMRPNRPDLKEVYDLFMTIEMPCVDAVCNMEDTGFTFDMNLQKELDVKYQKLLKDEEEILMDTLAKSEDIYMKWRKSKSANTSPGPKLDKAGNVKLDKKGNPEMQKTPAEQIPENIRDVNLGSPLQLAIILYDVMKAKNGLSKKDERSTGEEALKNINNEFTNALLKYRGFRKLVDAFITSLPEHIESDGRIHCSLNQLGAKTGRFSCSDPNLQQIPSNNKEIRRLFIAPTNYRDVEIDNNVYTFKDTEEIEVSPDNWQFVRMLKIGDTIETDTGKIKIANLKNENHMISLIVEEV